MLHLFWIGFLLAEFPGQVHQQSLETRPAVFSTRESTANDDDSYMGYSTIVGDFLNNGEQGIAVGMPRGNNLRGKVLLFSWNLTNFLHHFTSDQLGSYYGYALAATDVDGDGKLDLIIGAPMYTVQNNEDKYDIGRVYVVYHQSDKVQRFLKIDSALTFARVESCYKSEIIQKVASEKREARNNNKKSSGHTSIVK